MLRGSKPKHFPFRGLFRFWDHFQGTNPSKKVGGSGGSDMVYFQVDELRNRSYLPSPTNMELQSLFPRGKWSFYKGLCTSTLVGGRVCLVYPQVAASNSPNDVHQGDWSCCS